MKTPKEWLRELAMVGLNHPSDCKCDRCRYGEHCVLIESDIREIQQPLIATLEYVEKQMIGPASNSRYMQIAGPARSVLNAIREALQNSTL